MHVAYFFPFEHTQLVDENVAFVVEGRQPAYVILFDNLSALFQEMDNLSGYGTEALFLLPAKRVEIVVGMFETWFASPLDGMNDVIREIVSLEIVETLFQPHLVVQVRYSYGSQSLHLFEIPAFGFDVAHCLAQGAVTLVKKTCGHTLVEVGAPLQYFGKLFAAELTQQNKSLLLVFV